MSRSDPLDWLHAEPRVAAPAESSVGVAPGSAADLDWLCSPGVEAMSDFRQFIENEPPMTEWMVVVKKERRKNDYDI
jgi:hypothetical protein